MKKTLVLLIAAMFVICAIPASAAGEDRNPNLICTTAMYRNTDLSDHEIIYMILVGDIPADWPMVLEGINLELNDFNTTLDVTFLSWSDYPTLYPQILAGGDKVDLCYVASGWCYLWEGAAGGDFFVLTEEFIYNYMPMTARYQDPASWDEVRYGGDIVAVAQGSRYTVPALVGIREDLRTVYGLDAPVDYATFKAYLLGVAAHTGETGVVAYDCGKSEGIAEQYIRGNHVNLMPVANDWRCLSDGALPAAEQLTYFYMLDEYRAYLDEAKELSGAGVWSRGAMESAETAARSFANGTSAAVAGNYAVFRYMEMAEKIDGVACGCYDLWQDGPQITSSYNNSCMAIYAGAKDPARCAMVIDICMWDSVVNRTICFGLKDYHFTDDGGVYSPVAEHAWGYTPDSIALSWFACNGNMRGVFTDDREAAMRESVESRATANAAGSFVFDIEPVAACKAAVDSVRDEYRYALGMGFFGDADSAYGAFMDALDNAGFEVLDAELRQQYAAWYGTIAE